MFIILIGWIQGEKIITRQYSSCYKLPCEDTCDTHGNYYFWCNTKNGWDYCSPNENTDYKGQPCREDHPCRSYGKSYLWCYTEGGSWGYCGLLRNIAEPKTLLYLSSTYISECLNECFYDETNKYFWCDTEGGTTALHYLLSHTRTSHAAWTTIVTPMNLVTPGASQTQVLTTVDSSGLENASMSSQNI